MYVLTPNACEKVNFVGVVVQAVGCCLKRLFCLKSLHRSFVFPMAFQGWFVDKGFTIHDYEAGTQLGLEGPSDLVYAFTCQAEAGEAGLGGPWQDARRDAKANAYTAGVQLHMGVRRRILRPPGG